MANEQTPNHTNHRAYPMGKEKIPKNRGSRSLANLEVKATKSSGDRLKSKLLKFINTQDEERYKDKEKYKCRMCIDGKCKCLTCMDTPDKDIPSISYYPCGNCTGPIRMTRVTIRKRRLRMTRVVVY